MKVFCFVTNPHSNGAGLNFKRNLRPAALARFTKRENFKNFTARERTVNLITETGAANRAVDARPQGFEARAKVEDREAVSARCAGFAYRNAKTVSAMSIDRAASENILNFAPHKRCADRKNFKIFASDEIKFATRSEPKFTMCSMAKFTACSVKFEPRSTAARGFALCDRILNPRPRKSCASFKISSRRGEKAK